MCCKITMNSLFYRQTVKSASRVAHNCYNRASLTHLSMLSTPSITGSSSFALSTFSTSTSSSTSSTSSSSSSSFSADNSSMSHRHAFLLHPLLHGPSLRSSQQVIYGFGVDISHIPRFYKYIDVHISHLLTSRKSFHQSNIHPQDYFLSVDSPQFNSSASMLERFLKKAFHTDEMMAFQTLFVHSLTSELVALQSCITAGTSSVSVGLEKLQDSVKYQQARMKLATFLATRWAGKEAIIKASGKRLLFPEICISRQNTSAKPIDYTNSDKTSLNETEQTKVDADPRPFVILSGPTKDWFDKENIYEPVISLSHDQDHALAAALIEKKSL